MVEPKLRYDPTLDALVERGKTHEQGFVDHLAEQGGTATVLAGVGIDQASVTQTRQAMERGDAVIARAALRDGHLSGRADVLRRVGFHCLSPAPAKSGRIIASEASQVP